MSLGDDGDGWTHPLYSVSPGVPGDSGSAFVDANGKAIGVLSTIGLAPLPASNNIGDLNKELNYAQAHAGISGLQLVHGTEPFAPIRDPRPRPAKGREPLPALALRRGSVVDLSNPARKG